jgi:multidrug efflux pump subunit AcrA (membrane-fusion protein)
MAAIGASVLAAGGAVYSGQQQKKMSNYQAAQAEADAEAAQAAARVEADRIRKAGGHRQRRQMQRWLRQVWTLEKVPHCVFSPASWVMLSRMRTRPF